MLEDLACRTEHSGNHTDSKQPDATKQIYKLVLEDYHSIDHDIRGSNIHNRLNFIYVQVEGVKETKEAIPQTSEHVI